MGRISNAAGLDEVVISITQQNMSICQSKIINICYKKYISLCIIGTYSYRNIKLSFVEFPTWSRHIRDIHRRKAIVWKKSETWIRKLCMFETWFQQCKAKIGNFVTRFRFTLQFADHLITIIFIFSMCLLYRGTSQNINCLIWSTNVL